MKTLTIALAITFISIPMLAQGNGKPLKRIKGSTAAQQSAFAKGHCVIMRSPFYKPTRRDRVKRALRPLTLPGARSWLKKRGGVTGVIRRGMTRNWLARLPGMIRARRQVKLNGAIVSTLRGARSQRETGMFDIGRVVELKAAGRGVYNAKVSFLSKRSGGKTERIVRLEVDHGFLGLGKVTGKTPGVSVVGLRPGVNLSSLAPISATESAIMGQKTMFGIPGVTP